MPTLREVAKRVWYFGWKFDCVICGARTRTRKTFSFALPVLRELDVIGGEHQPNDDCPICYANQRSRLLYAYLTKHTIVQTCWRVLHVAPELALYRYVFSRLDVDYHPVDFSPEKYPEIDGVRQVDITSIPYPNGFFDLILCNHVLEHVPDDRKAMQELHRILKPTGTALLQVPLGTRLTKTIEDPSETDPKKRERRFGQFDHVRIYSEGDYANRLRHSGFAVRLLPAAAIVGSSGIKQYDLNARERLIVCHPAPELDAH